MQRGEELRRVRPPLEAFFTVALFRGIMHLGVRWRAEGNTVEHSVQKLRVLERIIRVCPKIGQLKHGIEKNILWHGGRVTTLILWWNTFRVNFEVVAS
jgi:hypothetical protein